MFTVMMILLLTSVTFAGIMYLLYRHEKHRREWFEYMNAMHNRLSDCLLQPSPSDLDPILDDMRKAPT